MLLFSYEGGSISRERDASDIVWWGDFFLWGLRGDPLRPGAEG